MLSFFQYLILLTLLVPPSPDVSSIFQTRITDREDKEREKNGKFFS